MEQFKNLVSYWDIFHLIVQGEMAVVSKEGVSSSKQPKSNSTVSRFLIKDMCIGLQGLASYFIYFVVLNTVWAADWLSR